MAGKRKLFRRIFLHMTKRALGQFSEPVQKTQNPGNSQHLHYCEFGSEKVKLKKLAEHFKEAHATLRNTVSKTLL